MATLPPQDGTKQTPPKVVEQPTALAVIVNPKNPTTNLTLDELRSYFKQKRTFWPNGTRTQLYLRKTGSPEMKMLLERVYRMTSAQLRRYLRGKNFRGEVTGGKSYTVAPTNDKAIARVRANDGAVSVVMMATAPAGVRVLSIDGKRPGEPGYPLAISGGAPRQ